MYFYLADIAQNGAVILYRNPENFVFEIKCHEGTVHIFRLVIILYVQVQHNKYGTNLPLLM